MPRMSREPTAVFGDPPHDDPPNATGFYAVLRCQMCSNIHLSIRAKLNTFPDRAPMMQLAMSAEEARTLAAELLLFAEGH